MVSERHREAARETMRRNWQDPAFRERARERARRTIRRTGSEHHNYKGGGKNAGGYVLVSVSGKRQMRSHAIWSAAYPDDPILPGETIHHRNRVRDDDRIENLEKLPLTVHTALHHKGRVWSPEHRAKAIAASRQAGRRFSMKSCGKAHASCKVCDPGRYSDEWRKKIAEANHKRPAPSAESRAKMAAAQRRIWERRKAQEQ